MSSNVIAPTPKPPYYAVIFSSLRTEANPGYGQMAEKMILLASQQPGFLGVENTSGSEGLGITVSYWESPEAIAKWKANFEHQVAQRVGKKVWYSDYIIRIARVDRDYKKDAIPQ